MKHEFVKTKIKALLNKTIENGCTPEEAKLASEKISQLVSKYQISEIETLSFENIEITRKPLDIQTYGRQRLCYFALVGIAEMCQVTSYHSKKENQICFVGKSHDVEIAEMIFEFLQTVVKLEIQKLKTTPEYKSAGSNKKSYISSFIKGFDCHMQTKLISMAAENKVNTKFTTGKDLVCDKMLEIQKYLRTLNVNLGSSSKKKVYIRNKNSYKNGVDLAKKTSINKGIRSSQEKQHRLLG